MSAAGIARVVRAHRFIYADEEELQAAVAAVLASRGVRAVREVRLSPRDRIDLSLRSGSGLDGLQQVCNVGVFGELDWAPGIHDQCEGRYHRDGQQQPSVSYFLVCDVGSDPVIADVLNIKEQGSRPIVDPDRPLFESADVSDRMRKLAESVLRKRKRVAA